MLLSLPPLLSALIALALGLFVWLKKPHSSTNRSFSFLCFETFWWQICWFSTYIFKEPWEKDLIVRTAWIGVVFIPFTYYEFVTRFLALTSELRWVKRAYAVPTIFLALIWSGDLFIAGTNNYWWGYYTKAGVLHRFYLIPVACCLTRSVFLLWRGTRETELAPIEKDRRRLAFLSLFIYLFAACEYLTNYGIPIYPMGVIMMPVAFFVSYYAIVRY